ncbi:hypothetical protein P8452_07312 [Trifolium repens]|nr:hypothetical protein P8452_07312 [Trifolium repens]
MVNDSTTYDSMKYDDNGERIVMLFGVNIAKNPTKVDDTPKDRSSMENINYIPHDKINITHNNKDISIFEHENENEKENENNERSEFNIGQNSKHEKMKSVIPWTPKEHRAFLKGLKAVGKGRWKHISKNYVMTKDPTQVASHAQKFFQRSEIDPMFRNKRQSIFDMKLLVWMMNMKIQKLLVFLLHWDHPPEATLIRCKCSNT